MKVEDVVLTRFFLVQVFQVHLKNVSLAAIAHLKLPQSVLSFVFELWRLLASKMDLSNTNPTSTVESDTFFGPKVTHIKASLLPHYLITHYIPCLIHLACLYHKLPVFLADIHNAMVKGDIPLLHVQVDPKLRHFISEMNNSVVPYWFNITRIPSLENTELIERRLLQFYSDSFKVKFPDLNGPLIWARLMKQFQLDGFFFCLTKEKLYTLVATIHGITSGFHHKPDERQPENRFTFSKEKLHGNLLDIVAPFVVAVKIIHGLDGTSRRPDFLKDYGCDVDVTPFAEWVNAVVKSLDLDKDTRSYQFGDEKRWRQNPGALSDFIDRWKGILLPEKAKFQEIVTLLDNTLPAMADGGTSRNAPEAEPPFKPQMRPQEAHSKYISYSLSHESKSDQLNRLYPIEYIYFLCIVAHVVGIEPEKIHFSLADVEFAMQDLDLLANQKPSSLREVSTRSALFE